MDSVKDDLSANVFPTAEAAETPVERVAISKLVPLTEADALLEAVVTVRSF